MISILKIKKTLLVVLLINFIQILNQPEATHAQTAELPFTPPFTTPPGPSTWLIAQQYGNTVGAYNTGKYQYAAGQGFHFGVDFSVPCGTPIVAIADGIVDGVDNLSHGALPHNLAIYHPDSGYISFYGHLLKKPTLARGQNVKRGEMIALSGDPDSTCVSRPHLHLEIRSRDYGTAYDPVTLMAADWPMLSSIGSAGGNFAKDLFFPNRWQTINDQPNVKFGGNILNLYKSAWPLPARSQPSAETRPDLAPLPIGPNGDRAFTRVTSPGCCSYAWWSADSGTINYWDGPDGQLASMLSVSPDGDSAPHIANNTPSRLRSPNGQYDLLLNGGRVSVIRLADEASWLVATDGATPRFSPGGTRLLWQFSAVDNVPGAAPAMTEIWISKVDGTERQLVRTQPGGAVSWLDDDRLLLSRRENNSLVSDLDLYSISTGLTTPLLKVSSLRGLSISPGGQRLIYYLTMQQDPAADGLYVLETQAGAAPRLMPFFGSWRWRDRETIIYIPFLPGQAPFFVAYNIASGTSVPLTDPIKQPFAIANDDWSISPNGKQLVFWSANDLALWTLTLPG